jgi:hypothetical protein
MKTCSSCNREMEATELTWPSVDGPGGPDLCQECWESQTDKMWWEMVNAMAEAGLTAEPES